ncbi:hypothetical protein Mapa_006300 [Marchantia paleacea]|nr:hypothetical protein Mapa_006300 [Marchantia paleacea]
MMIATSGREKFECLGTSSLRSGREHYRWTSRPGDKRTGHEVDRDRELEESVSSGKVTKSALYSEKT